VQRTVGTGRLSSCVTRRRGGLGRAGRTLSAFVAAAVAVGLLAAGLWTPAVAALGGLTNAGSDAFLALPSTFTMVQPAQGSRILAADGSVIATPQDEDRVVVPLSEVAPVMRTAQVAIEDSRASSKTCATPSPSSDRGARTRSSRATSTSPTTATARTASRRPRATTSACTQAR
jgi:hypothetical protein